MPSRLTIIIPTYNRNLFLKRIVEFYQTSEFKHHVLVADSSDSEQALRNKNLLSAFNANDTRVEYFHTREYFPNQGACTVHAKILKALSFVKTPYAALCADDDFLIPSALKTFADFLDAHADFSCAKGLIYEILPSKEEGYSLKPSPRVNSLESDHVTERVWLASRFYQQSVYGLFRTEVLHEILSSIPQSMIRHPGWLDELCFSTFAAVRGKIMRFEFPSEYRELHGSNLGHIVPMWPAVIFEDSLHALMLDYKEALTELLLLHHPTLERATAYTTAQSSLIAFSKWYYDTRYRDSHNRPCGSGTLHRRDFLQRVLDKLDALRLRAKAFLYTRQAMRFPETQKVMAAVAQYQSWQKPAHISSHTS